MPTWSVKPARGALLKYPKRKLSPLQRACVSLGLTIDAQPRTNLARLLCGAKLGKTGIEYLKLSKGELARQIVDLYHSLKSATERKAVTIDYLIMAAGADSHCVWGLIQEGISWATEFESMLLISMKSPDVARKAVERALTPEGHKDRELVLTIGGVLPT